ncbi:ankyrin repeat domain-containing protein 66-like [Amphiura filiformis]|uniref:ankyrin repeat domain-containing protein 66-like n=1 Tax=Amphiura filiformis TaxID=82378 RepID=UPI003B224C77
MTEVHEAAANGDSTQIETLMNTGRYDANAKDQEWHERTPMHWAALKGHGESIRTLYEYGGRFDSETESGWTPMHFAAEMGRLQAIKIMHKLGAPLDKPDNSGDTPQRLAEIYGHKECAEFLGNASREYNEQKSREAARKAAEKFIGKLGQRSLLSPKGMRKGAKSSGK